MISAIFGFFSGLSPKVYEILAVLVALAAFGGYMYYRGGVAPRAERDAAIARFEAFQAQVRQIGLDAEKTRAKDIADRKAISDKKEAYHAKRYAALDARYRLAVTAARVRPGPADPGSGQVQPLSSAAAILGCPDRSADIASRLADLEVGILGLIERGDKAIERTVTCKGWIDEQINVQ